MKHRMLRVNEVVKRELSGIVAREVSFEGALVTINHVNVNPDLKSAHVFVSVLGSEKAETVMTRLEEHRVAFQAELARRVTMKYTPHLLFYLDEAIARDTAIQNRLGTALLAVRSAKVWINIDHHPSNPGYGDLVYVDPDSPATGQILFELIKSEKLPVDSAIAENLYVAISTDTGSFQYPNTTARTFEIAAELVRAGVDVGRISQLTYENYPRRRVELLRDLLGTIRFDANDRVASFSLSLATAKKLGVQPGDNEGLIDHLRAMRGVIVAVLFEELADGKVRVSMRSKSKEVNVCAICEKFGGGGHVLAAGARVRGTLAEVEKKILEEIRGVLERKS